MVHRIHPPPSYKKPYFITFGQVRLYWVLGSHAGLGNRRHRLRRVAEIGYKKQFSLTLLNKNGKEGSLCSLSTSRESTEVCLHSIVMLYSERGYNGLFITLVSNDVFLFVGLTSLETFTELRFIKLCVQTFFNH